MKKYLFLLLFCLLAAVVQAAPLKVATLHPMLTDMATKIGGERLKVIGLFPKSGDLHSYMPGSGEFSTAAGAKLVLLCGKGFEDSFIEVLKAAFYERALLDVSKDIEDVPATPGSEETDPHWWNNPANMKTAAEAMTRELIRLDAEGKEVYEAGLAAYNKKMDGLCTYAKLMMEKIPAERRYLVTAHPAMAHFCQAFGMTPVVIKSKTGTKVDEEIAALEGKDIRCMFYDAKDNTEIFDQVSDRMECPRKPIFMDGVYPSMREYSVLFPYNVSVIYTYLKDKKESK